MDVAAIISAILAFLLYYNTLDADFVYDDRRAILTNPDLLPTTPWSRLIEDDFWGTPLNDSGSHGSYRPLTVLTFRLNYLLGGYQPWGYHFLNVLLHCAATVLLVRLSRHLLPKSCVQIGSLVTGTIFAAHPIHTEAVAGVVGRADLAAANFYFLTFFAYLAHMAYRDAACCDQSPSDSDKHYHESKYHQFVVGLQGKVTSCNWPRRSTRVAPPNDPHRKKRRVLSLLGLYGDEAVCACCWRKSLKQWCALFVVFLLTCAAMLSKETGLTVVGLCVVYDFLKTGCEHRKQWRSAVVLITASLLLLIFRLQAPTPQFSTADNPTAKAPHFLTRFLTFFYLPVFNLYLLLLPHTLSFDWGMNALPRITSMMDPRNLFTLVFYTALFHAATKCRKMLYASRGLCDDEVMLKARMKCSCSVCHHGLSDRHSQLCRTVNNNNNNNNINNNLFKCSCFHVTLRPLTKKSSANGRRMRKSESDCILIGLILTVLPFLPATNLFFYVGFVVAERVLYLPSAGLCLLFGLGAAKLWNLRKFRLTIVCGLLAVLVVFGVRTMMRNWDWRNEEALYRSAISVNPAKAYGNLGSILSGQGRIAEAEQAYRKALLHRPNMADVHYNMGLLLQGKKQLNEAIKSYQRAIHFRPSLALAYVNLGTALIAAGRCQEAVTVLLQCSRLDGTGLKNIREHETAKISALLQLGGLYSSQGRLQKALAIYKEAARSLPIHYPPQGVFNLVGETHARLQQNDEAERWYRAALQAKPDHVPAHITYGKLLAKNISRIAEAEEWFRRAQRIAPYDSNVYHYYGEFLVTRGRFEEAAVMYEKAAQLRPKDFEMIVAAATAMRQASKQIDAEKWYRKAVSLKPQDSRSHTNLGAILHMNGKYSEAAASYKEALRLEPDDITTLTNLHKLHSAIT